MKRLNFLKSLATLIAAPSLVKNIGINKDMELAKFKVNNANPPQSKNYTKEFNYFEKRNKRYLDNLLTSKQYKEFQEKYGSQNFTMYLNTMAK